VLKLPKFDGHPKEGILTLIGVSDEEEQSVQAVQPGERGQALKLKGPGSIYFLEWRNLTPCPADRAST
jgi:hypothetical protein